MDTKKEEENQSKISGDNQEEDEELTEILESALSDFAKQEHRIDLKATSSKQPTVINKSTGTKNKSQPTGPSQPEHADNIDEMLKNFMDKDPLLSEQWSKLNESCQKAAESKTDEEFSGFLTDTLKSITENAKSVADAPDFPDEELAKIWSNLCSMNEGLSAEAKIGEGADNPGGGILPDVMPMITNMMQNLLSKEVLYPALKDLTLKYPAWLQENEGKISAEDLNRYCEQRVLMEKVCVEFESYQEDDSSDVKGERFQRILVVMQKMQACGQPPPDLVADVPENLVPPGGGLDLSKLGAAAGGLGNAPGSCSLM